MIHDSVPPHDEEREEELEEDDAGDSGDLYPHVLPRANTLLATVGVRSPPIQSLAELQQSASSMFVAVFEAIFQIRLREIIRRPQHRGDWVNNAEVVIGKLRTFPLARDRLPAGMSGEQIVAGDLRAIALLVDVFTSVADICNAARDASTMVDGQPSSVSARGSPTEAGGAAYAAQEPTSESAGGPLGGSGETSGSQPPMEGGRKSRPIKRRKKSSTSPVQSMRTPTHGPPSHAGGAGGPSSVEAQPRSAVASEMGTRRDSKPLPRSRPRSAHKAPSSSSSTPQRPQTAPIFRVRAERRRPPQEHLEDSVENEVSRPFSAMNLSPGSLQRQVEALGKGYPSIWRGFMGQYARQAQGGKPASKRAQKNIQEKVDERNEHYRRIYQDLVADQERIKKMRFQAAEKLVRARARSIKHQERVDRIKVERLSEELEAKRTSERMKRETLAENRMKYFLQQILKRMHEWRREEDQEEVIRLKQLQRHGLRKAEAVESAYRQRLDMVRDFIEARRHENKVVYKAQESLLSGLVKELAELQDERIKAAIDRDQQHQKRAYRKSDELFHSLFDLMQVEDWEGARRDRFFTSHNSTLDKVLASQRKSMQQQRRLKRDKAGRAPGGGQVYTARRGSQSARP